MGTFYTIIRYIPDPIADERINFGAIVFDEQTVKAQFIQNWRRVQRFSGVDISLLKDFAQEFQEKQLSFLKHPQKWSKDTLMRAAERWEHSIQFSEPRASLKPCDELLAEVAKKFLIDEAVKIHRVKGRQQVIAGGVRKIKAVLAERFERKEVQELVKRHSPVKGTCGIHNYDIVVQNGHLEFALNTLAFESEETDRLHREVDAVAFAAWDVRQYDRKVPLAILAKEPQASSETFKYAEQTFGKLKVPFFTDDNVEKWARKLAKKIQL